MQDPNHWRACSSPWVSWDGVQRVCASGGEGRASALLALLLMGAPPPHAAQLPFRHPPRHSPCALAVPSSGHRAVGASQLRDGIGHPSPRLACAAAGQPHAAAGGGGGGCSVGGAPDAAPARRGVGRGGARDGSGGGRPVARARGAGQPGGHAAAGGPGADAAAGRGGSDESAAATAAAGVAAAAGGGGGERRTPRAHGQPRAGRVRAHLREERVGRRRRRRLGPWQHAQGHRAHARHPAVGGQGAGRA